MCLKTPAKVNLTLEVTGKRPDGYHNICSVIQAIDLRDTISFELAEGVHFSCNLPGLETEDNLVLKAVRLLQKETGASRGVRLALTKVIPEAAGLGGGSSDAATTLVGLNRLWQLNLSSSALSGLAARLGSDVPFFLVGGTALAEGRGEKVTPLPRLVQTYFVLLKPPVPPVPGKTGQLYSRLRPAHFNRGERTKKAVELVQRGQEIEQGVLFNIFEEVAFGVFPGLEEYRRRFLACGAPWARLAGSGPCLYTYSRDRSVAEGIHSRLRQSELECYMASSLNGIIREC